MLLYGCDRKAGNMVTEQAAKRVDESPPESTRVEQSPCVSECEHPSECPECSDMKITALRKNELRREIAERLGVSHLKGTPQLEAAVRRLDQLLLIEEIAIACEKDGLMTAAALEGASPALRA